MGDTQASNGLLLTIFSILTHISSYFTPATIGYTANIISVVTGVAGFILVVIKIANELFKFINRKKNK